MKKYLLAMLVALPMAPAGLQAQTTLGVKAGANLTSATTSVEPSGSMDQFDSSVGFYVGPVVNVALPLRGLSLDASLLYDLRRTTELDHFFYPAGYYSQTDSCSLHHHQLTAAISLRWQFAEMGPVGLFVFGGPQLGFPIGKKHTNAGYTFDEWRAKDCVFSINAGLGVSLCSHWQLSAGYNMACTCSMDRLFIIPDRRVYGKSHNRINALQIGLAYMF